MNVSTLISEIDAEIARLSRARKALATIGTDAPAKRRGRPPKNAASAPAKKAASKRRPLSAAARAKIAAAQRKRWAAQKKSSE